MNRLALWTGRGALWAKGRYLAKGGAGWPNPIGFLPLNQQQMVADQDDFAVLVLDRQALVDDAVAGAFVLPFFNDFDVAGDGVADGGQPPKRSAEGNAHAYLGAPYGIYPTADGYLALTMGAVPTLGELLDCPPLLEYTDPKPNSRSPSPRH